MVKTITELGPKEAKFLSLFATKNGGFIRLDEAAKFWKNKKLTYDVLSRLERKGWVARIEKGKYLVIPLEAGPDRKWSVDTHIIASELVSPSAIAYWSAIRSWNWTEQIPRITYIQTTSRKNRSRREIFGAQYEIVTVDKRKFYGHTKEWHGGKSVLVTEKEKTLIDCADDVERAGGIEELAKAVKSGASEISWQKLAQYADKFPNRAIKKRLGFLLEAVAKKLPDEAKNILRSWQGELSAGIIPIEPSGKKAGRVVTRWRLLVNAEIG